MFTYALTRKPAENFHQGLTTSLLGRPEYARIMGQHDAYVKTLSALGLKVIELDAQPEFPDAYFVEDTAVVTPRVAVIARPGAASRRGEEKTIEPVLASYRPVEPIRSPGTVDGGDVLMVGNRFFIGVSDRTNRAGAEQLSAILRQYGHETTLLAVGAGLHLKSSLNVVGENTLLTTAAFADLDLLREYHRIVLTETETYAANTLWLNDHLIMPRGFPDTRQKLEKLGLPIVELDVSEVEKMDGGLTCLSIRF